MTSARSLAAQAALEALATERRWMSTTEIGAYVDNSNPTLVSALGDLVSQGAIHRRAIMKGTRFWKYYAVPEVARETAPPTGDPPSPRYERPRSPHVALVRDMARKLDTGEPVDTAALAHALVQAKALAQVYGLAAEDRRIAQAVAARTAQALGWETQGGPS